MKRILVACPVYDGMEYCFSKFINHLKEIDYPSFEILIVDNSKTKKFFRKIKNIPNIKTIYDENSEIKNIKRLIQSRNKILNYAIKKEYDYLLMLDSDIMVPKNILKELIFPEKDIVSGLYFNFFKFNEKLELLPVAYMPVSETEFLVLKEKNKFPDEIKSNKDLRRHLNKLEIEKNDLIEVLYPCAGCLLLSKKAFSSGAKYGLEEMPSGEKTSDEIYFFNELRKKEFKFYVAPKLICKHDILKKYSDGIHPLNK